jgi:hypothetical protein
MSIYNFSIKNRLFLGVAFLLLLIVLIWILSWHWASYFESRRLIGRGVFSKQSMQSVMSGRNLKKIPTRLRRLGLVLNGLLQTVREEEKNKICSERFNQDSSGKVGAMAGG